MHYIMGSKVTYWWYKNRVSFSVRFPRGDRMWPRISLDFASRKSHSRRASFCIHLRPPRGGYYGYHWIHLWPSRQYREQSTPSHVPNDGVHLWASTAQHGLQYTDRWIHPCIWPNTVHGRGRITLWLHAGSLAARVIWPHLKPILDLGTGSVTVPGREQARSLQAFSTQLAISKGSLQKRKTKASFFEVVRVLKEVLYYSAFKVYF